MKILRFSKIVISNLFNLSRPAKYPNVKNSYYDITRGHIKIDIDKCILCGLCSNKCPAKAITVNRTEKYWKIDRLRCIQCNSCVESCPKKCLIMDKNHTKPTRGELVDIYEKSY